MLSSPDSGDVQHERSWLSDATCQSARWQITKFLGFLEQRSLGLETIHPADVDAFYQHMALRWSRRSLNRSVSFLRAWLGYCDRRGYARPGLAQALLAPRIYRHETLPMGPTWPTVGRMLAATGGGEMQHAARNLRTGGEIVWLRERWFQRDSVTKSIG